MQRSFVSLATSYRSHVIKRRGRSASGRARTHWTRFGARVRRIYACRLAVAPESGRDTTGALKSHHLDFNTFDQDSLERIAQIASLIPILNLRARPTRFSTRPEHVDLVASSWGPTASSMSCIVALIDGEDFEQFTAAATSSEYLEFE
jgi:hypothetical protein